MNFFLLNVALALTWGALTGLFTPTNLLFGFALGYAALLLSRRALGRTNYFAKMRQVLSLVGLFFWELVLANIRVALDVLTPRYRMSPRVLAVPLEPGTDAQITVLANLISLTPGTLSLDVSTDRRVLYIHAMYAADEERVRREIKDVWERRVRALMGTPAGPTTPAAPAEPPGEE